MAALHTVHGSRQRQAQLRWRLCCLASESSSTGASTGTSSSSPDVSASADAIKGRPSKRLQGHIIICGIETSFEGFARQLRLCAGTAAPPLPLLLLHPTFPSKAFDNTLSSLGHVYFVQGSPADPAALQEAYAETAR
jgi:hypothetical protein